MPTAMRDVRSRGQSGKHILAVSLSGFDPRQTFLMSSYRVLRRKQSRKGEFAMRRAVLICAVLAVLSPTCAEAAERVWRLGFLTLPGTAASNAFGAIMLPYLATHGFVEGRNLIVDFRAGTEEQMP